MFGYALVKNERLGSLLLNENIYKEAFAKSLEMLDRSLTRENKGLQVLKTSLTILVRIRQRYPYIFGECVDSKEMEIMSINLTDCGKE